VSLITQIGYGGIVYAGADAASQRRLNMAFRACLRYIHPLRRLDHSFSFCRVFTKCCMSGIRAICSRYFILLRPRVPGICVEYAASWHGDFAYAGFICYRCEEDGPWR
jgi:hypothetical protein